MKYIKIKDWEKHQHYKDRNPPWIKLQNQLLTDYEFSRLSDASKLQLILLWLLASQLDNKIPADEAWIQSNIKTKAKVNLKPLKDLGFIDLYQDASGCVQDACLEGETEAEKEREKRQKNSRAKKSEYSKYFLSFWDIYCRKEDKKSAYKAWCKLLDEGVDVVEVIEGAKRYAQFCKEDGKELKHIKLPATFLNGACYENTYNTNIPIAKKIDKAKMVFNNAVNEIVGGYSKAVDKDAYWGTIYDKWQDQALYNGFDCVTVAKDKIRSGK